MKSNSLTSMSFNVYVGAPPPQREISVLQTILSCSPDTLGVQEASPSWMEFFEKNLNHIYGYVGEGRDGLSNGEYNAIFYKKDRFELIESGTKWLSDTPDTVSKFPESCLFRIFTYAILSEKASGIKFLVINTHLDHIGPAPRNRQAPVILDFIKKHPSYPVVFTGDLNDTPESEIFKVISGRLTSAASLVPDAEEIHTFHNYGAADVTLDYIFVSPEGINVSDYRVITDEANGMLPSDHYPVLIEYQIEK